MGAAGVEGSSSALCGADAEDVGNDETIGDKSGTGRHHNVHANQNKDHNLIVISAGAGKLEHWEDITQIMIDKVCITEGQSCHAKSMGQGTPASHHICTKYEHSTYPWGQYNIIQQRLANSNITVICHGSQYITFCDDEEAKEVELGQTACIGDGVFLHHKIH